MAEDSRTAIEEAREAGAVLAAAAKGPTEPATNPSGTVWRKSGTALIAYLLDSEVHTFAFSVAANAIISFIPFVVLLYTLALRGLSFAPKGPMVVVVDDMVNYFLPSVTKQPDWLTNSIGGRCSRFIAARRAGAFAGDDSHFVHGDFPAAGGGSQPSMGRDQEPQLPLQPDHRLRAGAADGGAGRGQHGGERERGQGARRCSRA